MLTFLLIFFLISPAAVGYAAPNLTPAESREQRLVEQYAAQGSLAAQRLKEQFEQKDKPAFAAAYDDYLRDLEVIAKTGRAPDNEALYDDLRQMNSNEFVIYEQQRGEIRAGFGNIMRGN